MTDETVAYMGWGISAQEQIDGFRKEVRELRDENAKLRAARDTWAENDARLRELVRDMRACIGHACLCDFCSRFAAEDIDEARCLAEMDSRMAQLGMEVQG